MARGFDSKAVEEQIAEGDRQKAADQARQQAVRATATTSRERQALELQRERVLSERTSSPHRRAALAQALGEIEAKLTSLK